MKWPWVTWATHEKVVQKYVLLIDERNALAGEVLQLKAKLRDYEQPPIESGDLQSLLKRHSFLQTKCASLEAENERLKSRIQELHGQPEKPQPLTVVGQPTRNTGV